MSTNTTEALKFHSANPSGKVGISVTKDVEGNISLAYSPGVAEPCIAIGRDAQEALKYTNLGNRVCIISNGTAILGLGNLNPIASKPVLEGKCALFKVLSGIDCTDLVITGTKAREMANSIIPIADSFSGIMLEDIAAPECFELEEILQKELDIPVFHDDQHGTAVVCLAALLNSIKKTGKKLEEMKVVCLGAGAAGLACLRLMVAAGIQNPIVFDSKGLIHKKRKDLNKYKEYFAVDLDFLKLKEEEHIYRQKADKPELGEQDRDHAEEKHASTHREFSIEEALDGADIFLGTSVGNALKSEWLRKTAKDPLILALANPLPEINPAEALKERPDAMVCTGRSDYPNQVNNVFCFPYLFRVLLDNRHTLKLDDNLKMIVARAIASLAPADSLMPLATEVSIRYLLPGLIMEEYTKEEQSEYNKQIATQLLPTSSSFNVAQILKSKHYLDFGCSTICKAWGMSKLNHEIDLIKEHNNGFGLWLILIEGKLVFIEGDLRVKKDVIGCIINQKKIYYNEHARKDYLSIFAVYCAEFYLKKHIPILTET